MKNLASSPVVFLLFLIFSKSLFSQNLRLADSLHQRILLEKNDSSLSILYSILADEFYNPNLDSAEALVRRGCFFAKKSGCTTCLIECFRGYGYAKNRRYLLDESIAFYDTAQVLAEKSKNWCVLADIFSNKGGAFNRKKDYETALKWNRKAVELYETSGCPPARAFVLNFNLSSNLSNMGRGEESLAPLRKAVEAAERSGNVSHRLIGLKTMANRLIDAQKPEESKSFALRSLQLSRSIGDKFGETEALYMLGMAAAMQHQDEINYGYMKQALEIFGDSQDLFMKNQLYSAAAVACAYSGRDEEALEILKVAYPLAQKQDALSSLTNCLRAFGKAFQLQNKLDEAEKYFLEAVELTDEYPEQSLLRSVAKNSLFDFYKHAGLWEKALQVQQDYQKMLDEQHNNDQQIQLAVLETELRFHKDAADRDRQLAARDLDFLNLKNEKLQADFLFSKQGRELLARQLEAEKQEANLLVLQNSEREKTLENAALDAEINQKSAENKAKSAELSLQSTQIRLQQLLFGLLSIGLLASFWWGFSFFKKRQKQNILTLRANISRDLHDDLGSEISSISLASFAAARSGDPERMRPALENIAGQSQKLVEDMRDIVWSLNPTNDTFDKLLARVRQFAAQVFENQEKVSLKFFTSGDPKTLKLDPEARRHIYLFLKEAINNIGKYADCTEATVTVNIKKDHFLIEIRDNGLGFDPKSVAEGNGLPNLRVRAAAVGGDFEVVSGAGKGTLIRLSCRFFR